MSHGTNGTIARGRVLQRENESCTLLRESPLLARAANARLAWTGRTSKVITTRRHICFACCRGWFTVHMRRHHREVCPLSRGVRLQPLSGPLQVGLRLLPVPLPAAPSAPLTSRFPPGDCPLTERFPDGRATGLPRSVSLSEWVGLCLSAGGTTSAAENPPFSAPGHVPFGPSP